jgi:microcystin synthetase protein McyB/microcystin synthetase protein McyC
MLLHQYSHQEDLLVSFPYSGRNNLYLEKTIGYFVNVIVFRSTVKPNDTLLDYIIRCKKNILEDSVYWDVPLEEIYPKLDVQVDPSSNPLFQVMFAFQEKTVEGISPSRIIYKTTEIPNNSSKLDIFLEVQDKTDGLLLKFNYSTSLFKRNKIERFAGDFVKIVNLFQKEPDAPVKSLSLITPTEINLIKQWNNTTFEHSENLVIYDLFTNAFKRHQNKVAVRTPSEDYSYKQLNDRVLKFASKLVSNGINRAKPVGISMFPGIDMVTTLLSLSRLGVPFVPLDPSYPETHISYIISHSNLSHIITDDINRHVSPETKMISHQTPESSTYNIQDITPNENDDLYIIFTSGSTGKPKGVPATNKSVANLLIWLRNKMKISSEDVFLFQSSINFDISMVEIFLPLITGGSLVITGKEKIKSWDHIHDIIRDFEITILQFVPSALWAFLATAPDNYVSSLRFTITGGEPLTPELKKAFLKKIDCKLVNLYGPTEGTIYVSGTGCNPDTDSVTIGKPVYNTKIHILNRNLNQVPIGFKGDIYISGIGVTRGYFNNEEETKKHFIYHKEPGVRLFKTGDTGSFREDGNIEFWGREDRQVKIRGFRIELSQVEAALEKIKEIEKVCVLMHQISKTDKRLIAFYTSQNGAFTASSLRKIISRQIPTYMIPSEFYHLKEFNKLPNGKIDTQNLLSNIEKIRNNKPQNYKNRFINNIERKIKEIWEQVLGKNDFNTDDNFFDVGGHSLLILEVKELIEKKLNKSVTLTDLYKFSDIKSLAGMFMEDESNLALINEIRQRVAQRRKQQKINNKI